jgi:outer membrane lipoprotein-sorting protein
VKILRTLSTPRLITIAALAVIMAAVGATLAVAASGGSGQTPPAKPLAQAAHDALAGDPPTGVTARITFTNKLFPSGALTGAAGSALMSGATGRLWVNTNGGRLELQSDAGDTQITWNDAKVTVYDASSNTAYTFDLPAKPATTADPSAVPSVDQITTFLTEAAKDWNISGADPSNVAGEPAYTVKVSPSHDGGLLGSAQLAWDALHGDVPLRIAIYAQGASSPALALEADQISFGAVPDSDVQVSPPAGAKVVDLSSQTQGGTGAGNGAPVTGLAAVQAAAGFPVTAPDTLVGLPRQDVRLVGPKDSPAALVVVERAKDTSAAGQSPLSSLPSVSIDGLTGHELATQLGTILTWDRGGVSYVLAGSVPSSAAETAARAF